MFRASSFRYPGAAAPSSLVPTCSSRAAAGSMAREVPDHPSLLRLIEHQNMAPTHTQLPRATRIHQRIDRLMADTLRRFFTVAISATGFAVIVCCLNSLR